MKKLKLFCFNLLIFFQSVLFAQWHWQNPIPIGKPIYDLQFIDSLNGYVCGYGGMVLKTTNGGTKWDELEIPSDGLIIRVFFLNADIGWYLSYSDMSLFKTTDAGLTWEFVSSFSPKYATTIWFVNELIGFAGGYQNLLKTTDGGLNWVEDNNVGSAYSIQFLNENIGFAGSHNRINKTTDGGNTWTYKGIPAFSLNPTKIYIYDTNNIYVVGRGESIFGDPIYLYYHSSNGGTSWIGKSFEKNITDVYFSSPQNGFICSGRILKTSNRGVDWDSTDFWADQLEFNGNHSWSAGTNTISYSEDGWLSATPQIKSIFSSFLWDGCAKDTNVAFACGSNKTIIGTTNGGMDWINFYSGSDNYYLNGITFKGDEVWAVGQHGTVISSKDNGTTWNEKTIIDGNWLSDITFNSDGVGYIVGSYAGGGIFTSLDQGETWSVLEYYPDLWSVDKIKFSRDGLGWATGYPYAILKSTTNGRSWEVVVDSIYSAGNIAVSGDTAWIMYNNKVLRTTDAGNNWESFKVFDYTGVIFSGCDIDFINSKVGYVCAYDSRVFKSIDGGETWLPENYPKGLSNFAMDFVNQEVGWVFGYPGIILKRDPSFVSIEEPRFNYSDPENLILNQNYPNPFNPATTIKYTIPNVILSGVEGSRVTLKVYDILGKEIAILVNEEQPAGIYEVEFNPALINRNLASGIYFYQLKAGIFIDTKKMILIK